MALSTRFALGTTAVVAGGFLAVSAFAFAVPVVGWLGFAVSTAVAVAALVSTATTRKNSVRIGHGVLATVGLWSLIAALVFSGPALMWLVFADALALAVVALADLTAHEVSADRVVQTLDVRSIDATRVAAVAH